MASSKKPNIIPPEIVKERIKKILQGLANPTDFEFNMLLLQTANWPKAKRRQVFRAVLKTLMTENQSYTWRIVNPILRQSNVTSYACHSQLITTKLFDKFVSKVIEMEKNSRFMPEKVFTLPKMNTKMLQVDPAMLSYLFDNNILVLSEGFEWSAINILPMTENQYIYRYMKHNIGNIDKLYDIYDLNKNLLFSPNKLHVTGAARMIQNIEIIADKLLKKETLTSSNRVALNDTLVLLKNLSVTLNTDMQKLMRANKKEFEVINDILKGRREVDDIGNAEFFKIRADIDTRIDSLSEEVLLRLGKDNEEKFIEFTGETFDPFTAKI